jgi:hypothetical protein
VPKSRSAIFFGQDCAGLTYPVCKKTTPVPTANWKCFPALHALVGRTAFEAAA